MAASTSSPQTGDAQPQIVICDDEEELRDILSRYFTRRGFTIKEASCAQELLEAIDEETSAVLLDVNMPGGDGLSALKELRTTSDVPVVMLTALAETVDRIVGIELGADDYIAKPFDLREVEARLKAILRRGKPAREDDKAANHHGAAVGPYTLDIDAARLFSETGEEIPITAMEFSLLKTLVEHRGRVVSREALLDEAHARGWDPFDRSIDLRISRLRKKIETNPAKPQIIRTARGLGYMLD